MPNTFDEVDGFRDQLSVELAAAGIAGGVSIDSTLTGRHITVFVEDPEALPNDFGAVVPANAFSIAQGSVTLATNG